MKSTLRLLAGAFALVSCAGLFDGDQYGTGSWNKPRWIADAVRTIASGRYPQVKAISYWHEKWKNDDGLYSDLRLNSSNEAAQAYRDGTKSSMFVTQPEYSIAVDMWKFEPPASGVYLAAFPGFGATEDIVSGNTLADFESIAGHRVAWAYFSDNWYHGIQFPSINVAKIHAAGRVPFIRMMMRSQENNPCPDPKYSLQQIIDGKYDKDLTKWAQEAKGTGLPMLVEFGTEVNGDWFSWNGKYNGGGDKNGFGDPNKADGPERFVAAYRRIVDTFRREGAYNVSWAWHVDAESSPSNSWNQISEYWPGADYVDWIGVSIYGPQKPTEPGGTSFEAILDRVYPQLTKLSTEKPIAILEWGITEP